MILGHFTENDDMGHSVQTVQQNEVINECSLHLEKFAKKYNLRVLLLSKLLFTWSQEYLLRWWTVTSLKTEPWWMLFLLRNLSYCSSRSLREGGNSEKINLECPVVVSFSSLLLLNYDPEPRWRISECRATEIFMCDSALREAHPGTGNITQYKSYIYTTRCLLLRNWRQSLIIILSCYTLAWNLLSTAWSPTWRLCLSP